ncbi:MAG: hypothetical protein ACOC1K_08060 [Nanoarchaeota archaeon]
MKLKIKKDGKTIEVKDVDKCEGIKKFTGLMFKSQGSNAKLFEFKKTKQAIHSLFCPKFLAVWLDENNKVIEYEFIYSSRLTIKPDHKYSRLLEIPINKKYRKIIRKFNKMNKYEKKYHKIVERYIEKGYSELSNYRIEIEEVEDVNYYALAYYKKPGVFTIKLSKKVRKWSKNGVKAMLSHELGHFIVYKKIGWILTRISDWLEEKFRFWKRVQERKADRIAIKRGCGECILKSREEMEKGKREKKDEKNKKPIYLTAKEIEEEMEKYR